MILLKAFLSLPLEVTALALASLATTVWVDSPVLEVVEPALLEFFTNSKLVTYPWPASIEWVHCFIYQGPDHRLPTFSNINTWEEASKGLPTTCIWQTSLLSVYFKPPLALALAAQAHLSIPPYLLNRLW